MNNIFTRRQPTPGELFWKADNLDTEPPDFIKLNSEDERHLWRIFVTARGLDEWRDCDYYLLHEIIQLDLLARRELYLISQEGTVLVSEHGRSYTNPRLSAYKDFNTHRMRLMRMLGISVPQSRAPQLNAHGIYNAKAARAEGLPLLAS